MCGICGVLGLSSSRGRAAVGRMLPWIRHRGPDGEGSFVDDGVALAHSRLAIRGLIQGRQPFSKAGCSLVFNGELYGAEVESSCVKEGCGDTSYLFSRLHQQGPRALEELEGMFALAFWDGEKRSCLLARDRAGEKPLFFAPQDGGVFFFASELRALIAGLGSCPSVNQMGLSHYLSLGYVPSPGTILDGVFQLEPGSFLVWEEGVGSRSGKYWSVFDLLTVEGTRAPEEESILKTLRESIQWRLKADVPAGFLVSGGLDSSAVVTLASQQGAVEAPCFSLGFEEEGYDELPWAEEVVSPLGLRHFAKRLGREDIAELAERAFAAMDGPMGDPSWIPTFALAEMTATEVKVALGGDGADELFGGYQAFAFENLAAFFERHGKIPVRGIGGLIARFSPSKGYRTPRYAIHQFLKGLGMPSRQRHFVWLGAWTPAESAELIGLGRSGLRAFWSFLPEDDPDRDRGNVLLAHYFRYYLGECLLVKSDRASMAHGLEIRSPFLDSRMVELAMRIPYSSKIRGTQTKCCLKEALSPLLDQALLKRPKQGFAPPLSDWVRGVLQEPLRESLLRLESRWAVLPSAEPLRLFGEHLSGIRDHRRKLWVLWALDRGLENLSKVVA